jgi:hypothetical protein
MLPVLSGRVHNYDACGCVVERGKNLHSAGAGIGASHQTGWTGLVALLIEIFGRLDARAYLEAGRAAAFARD